MIVAHGTLRTRADLGFQEFFVVLKVAIYQQGQASFLVTFRLQEQVALDLDGRTYLLKIAGLSIDLENIRRFLACSYRRTRSVRGDQDGEKK